MLINFNWIEDVNVYRIISHVYICFVHGYIHETVLYMRL